MMLSAATSDAAIKIAVQRIGAAPVFERLWGEIVPSRHRGAD
jgi:hypothetical protein